MPFICPECSQPGALRIIHSLELPPDSAWDEITLQIVQCSRCEFSALAIYQESRRGALDSEIWNHIGYRLDREALATLKAAMKRCPAPKNSRCQCATHRSLGRRAPDTGRWEEVNGLDWETSFAMRLR